MDQPEKKVFNEGKYQKHRQVMNYVGMAVVIGSVLVGGLVMYLGNRFVRKEVFETSSIQKEVSEKRIVLKDGSLVPVPHNQEEYQEALAKVDAQYPNYDVFKDGYNPEEYMARSSDKQALESAYKTYIESQQQVGDDGMFGRLEGFAGVMPKIFLTIISLFPGLMIMLIGVSIGSKILVTANGRGIAGFFAQSFTPVVKETIEDVAPTINKVKKERLDTMAPSIGNLAEEISKGIKKGLSDKDKK